MNKLQALKDNFTEQSRVAQNLYSRRKQDSSTGVYKSTMGDIMKTPNYGYKIGD